MSGLLKANPRPRKIPHVVKMLATFLSFILQHPHGRVRHGGWLCNLWGLLASLAELVSPRGDFVLKTKVVRLRKKH